MPEHIWQDPGKPRRWLVEIYLPMGAYDFLAKTADYGKGLSTLPHIVAQKCLRLVLDNPKTHARIPEYVVGGASPMNRVVLNLKPETFIALVKLAEKYDLTLPELCARIVCLVARRWPEKAIELVKRFKAEQESELEEERKRKLSA